ncbi:hypothetical protein J4405_00630 [Candidatus Woesearchaeota archaeon]|nr:hypothetical protein [Candidatus Woesearchaeota archaeon]
MGNWAKSAYGQESFAGIGIVVAGTSNKEFEKKTISKFDKLISSKDKVYHANLVEKNKIVYPLVFNIYGASAMVDVLAEMHDGGCRNVIFIGYAYGGFKNIDVGSIVIPDKCYHFDGIYSHIDQNRKIALPDAELKKKIESLFKKSKIKFQTGTNISVPAVTFQPKHANEDYKKIKPISLEMELASCLSRAKDLGMRTIGILIISDNRSHSLNNNAKKSIKENSKEEVIDLIINNLKELNLKKLKLKKDFSINEYLASVIENSEDVTNIYKKKI